MSAFWIRHLDLDPKILFIRTCCRDKNIFWFVGPWTRMNSLLIKQKLCHCLKVRTCHCICSTQPNAIFGMATLPFLCRDPFSPKYHSKKMEAWLFFCQFPIFVWVKKQICICINGPDRHCYCLLFSYDLVSNYFFKMLPPYATFGIKTCQKLTFFVF